MRWKREEKREEEEGGRDDDGRDGDGSVEAPCGFIVGRVVCFSSRLVGNSQTSVRSVQERSRR